ncbi:MAG: hypothetical protein JWM01_178, partial [Arthrobacter sp.]|nr:hypothetical protein [Arthrobacter sp.]
STTTGKVVNTAEKTETKRTVISTLTGLTKKIDGVNTVVVRDRDNSDGGLAESELAFFAETKKGTVWLFGEYPEEYEDGKLIRAPSTFISGMTRPRPESSCWTTPARMPRHIPRPTHPAWTSWTVRRS